MFGIPTEIWDNLFLALKIVWRLAPFWLPIIFLNFAFKAWVNYKRADYWNNKLGSVLLELKLPREIYKSPLAMELVLNQLHQTADEGNRYLKYWKGQTRSWFSLEITSFGGEIHFYIWTRKKYRNGIEAHLYSQYPGIEIYEAEDYTKNFYYDPSQYKMFACQWELSEADPYPISTYVDYGLDKDPKEEYKIDPMTSQLEFLGTLTRGHNIWIQIIVRAHKKAKRLLPISEWFSKFALFEEYDSWKDEAKAEIDKIRKSLQPDDKAFPRLATKGEQDRIAALERSIGKPGFDVSIRSIYFANKDTYDAVFLGGLLGSFKQYSALGYNGFKSAGWSGKYGNPWEDWWKPDVTTLMPKVLEEYKFRSFFFSDYEGKWYYSKPFILNSEELATIFHLPGSVASTPTLDRVPSRKIEAPANLPI